MGNMQFEWYLGGGGDGTANLRESWLIGANEQPSANMVTNKRMLLFVALFVDIEPLSTRHSE
jgi:hypothetical protein